MISAYALGAVVAAVASVDPAPSTVEEVAVLTGYAPSTALRALRRAVRDGYLARAPGGYVVAPEARARRASEAGRGDLVLDGDDLLAAVAGALYLADAAPLRARSDVRAEVGAWLIGVLCDEDVFLSTAEA